MNEAQEIILDHYKNPRNFGKPDWQITHSATVENPICGDEISIFLKILNDDTIEEVAFEGEGCSIAVASASILYDSLKNKSIDVVKEMTYEQLEEMIGIELTLQRQKCANLSLEALKKALFDASVLQSRK